MTLVERIRRWWRSRHPAVPIEHAPPPRVSREDIVALHDRAVLRKRDTAGPRVQLQPRTSRRAMKKDRR